MKPGSDAKLILASESRYRRELLERLRLPFQSLRPALNEEDIKQDLLQSGASPKAIAEGLAFAKAKSIAELNPESWVIGSDQLLNLDGEILGKAPNAELAEAQLAKISGRCHELITAVSLIWRSGTHQEHHAYCNVSRIQIRSLSPAEIKRYVAQELPFDCAGSYKMESLGIGLVDEIQSTDFTAIIGLPLIELARHLRKIGFNVP